jgi:hypothetical protein
LRLVWLCLLGLDIAVALARCAGIARRFQFISQIAKRERKSEDKQDGKLFHGSLARRRLKEHSASIPKTVLSQMLDTDPLK